MRTQKGGSPAGAESALRSFSAHTTHRYRAVARYRRATIMPIMSEESVFEDLLVVELASVSAERDGVVIAKPEEDE